jgi:hypothetical protein
MTVIMTTKTRLPISSIAFSSAFLVPILGVIGSAGAADCLTAPGSSAPPGSHWYYRTDQTQQRKCWYLGAVHGPSQEEAVNTPQSVSPGAVSPGAVSPAAVSPAAPYSLANFRDFLAKRGNTHLSDKDIEQLYAKFQAWRRRPQNEARNHQ